MYNRNIFLHTRGDSSVWISTHMVHMRMETRIDQCNINIWLTFLKITKIMSLELGIVAKRAVFVFVSLTEVWHMAYCTLLGVFW